MPSRIEPASETGRRDAAPRRSNASGEIAVVGDVHGCGRSLEALLDRLERESPQARTILVGDLLTKGDAPELVVELLRSRSASGASLEAVCGNHDRRMLAAILAVEHGGEVGDLPGTERRCFERLDRAGLLDAAREILEETVARIELRDSRGAWTVLHAGLDPRLGLAQTPDEVKWSIKARPGERHWWDAYAGADGLIVFGHKPVTTPIRRCVERRPVAVNVDTGCVYGGALTAYLVGADRFLRVPGLESARESGLPREIPRRRRVTPAGDRRGSSARPAASAAPARRPADWSSGSAGPASA